MFTRQLIFTIYALEDNRKGKYSRDGNKKEEGALSITRARFKLIELETLLMLSGLPDRSLDSTNDKKFSYLPLF